MTSPPPLPVVLATSNGVGMGHLTRQIVVALAGAGMLDPTVFSMSVAVPVAGDHGIRSEYCPGIDRDWMPRLAWHRYLEDRITALVRETGARAFVFDGVTPYPGIVLARRELRDIPFVWVRRGMWQPVVNDPALERSALFDLILEPGDLGASADTGPTAGRGDAQLIGPITMVDVAPPLTREEAAAALGIDPSRPTALVTLGPGMSGSAASPGDIAVGTLLEAGHWQVCVTRSYLEVPAADTSSTVTVLSGVYPLARYLAAFDMAVSAAGYNSVHELLPARVPTLLVPNNAARTDDQESRAAAVAAEGLALCADPADPAAVSAAVWRLLDDGVRRELAAACAALPPGRRGGGGAEAASHIAAVGRSHRPRPVNLGTRFALAEMSVKETAKRLLGPTATAVVRKMLRRPPQKEGIDRPLRVHIASGPGAADTGPGRRLLLTSAVTADLLRGFDVVEALVSGATARYVEERRRIVARTYDVVG